MPAHGQTTHTRVLTKMRTPVRTLPVPWLQLDMLVGQQTWDATSVHLLSVL